MARYALRGNVGLYEVYVENKVSTYTTNRQAFKQQANTAVMLDSFARCVNSPLGLDRWHQHVHSVQSLLVILAVIVEIAAFVCRICVFFFIALCLCVLICRVLEIFHRVCANL